MSRKKGPAPPFIFLFLLSIQFLVAKYLLFLELWFQVNLWLTYCLILFGFMITLLSFIELRRRKTTFIVFKRSRTLITDKLFGYSRNPMYVGMLFILVGMGFIFNNIGSILTTFLFIPIMNNRVIQHEEKMLSEGFCDDYILYKSNVRKWIGW